MIKSILILILLIFFKFSFSQSSVLLYAFSTKPNFCIFDINLTTDTKKEQRIFRLYGDSTFIITVFVKGRVVNGSCWGRGMNDYSYEKRGWWSRNGKRINLNTPSDGKSFGWHEYIEGDIVGGTFYPMYDRPTKLYILNQDCIAKLNELDNLKKKVNIQ